MHAGQDWRRISAEAAGEGVGLVGQIWIGSEETDM